MKKLADYQVVKEEDLDELQKQVRKLIVERWEPIGGVAIASHTDVNKKQDGGKTYVAMIYIQAMALYDQQS